jgi:precorrin-6A/cobalt-precorrin-6A reductase
LKPRILILGGTAHARRLATVLSADYQVVYSLAGATKKPSLPSCKIITGGFSLYEGLELYLCNNPVDWVIDACHHFATSMSAVALKACLNINIPLLQYKLPLWQPALDDNWVMLDDFNVATNVIKQLPAQRIFLTTGSRASETLYQAEQHQYLLRSVEPVLALPTRVRSLLAKGPFSVEAETQLLLSNKINLLVSKNSGGCRAKHKLIAAQALKLPVLMITPPKSPRHNRCSSEEQVLRVLRSQC